MQWYGENGCVKNWLIGQSMKERPMFSTFIFHLRFLSTFHKRDSSLENAKENVEQIIVQTIVVIHVYLDQYK